jgi:hypothetical protein
VKKFNEGERLQKISEVEKLAFAHVDAKKMKIKDGTSKIHEKYNK